MEERVARPCRNHKLHNAYRKHQETCIHGSADLPDRKTEKHIKKTDCHANMGRRSSEEGVAERLGSIKKVHEGTTGA